MAFYLHVCSGLLDNNFPWSFSLHSQSALGESPAETIWAQSMEAMFGTASLQALFATTLSMTETYTSTMDATFHQTTKTTTTHNLVGQATESLPFHVAEVVTWRSVFATRWGRGRWYLPPLGTGALATNGWFMSSAAVTAIVAGVNAAITTWGAQIQPQILHRKGNQNGAVSPLSLSPITLGDVGDGFDTQRRRGDKRVEARQQLTF